MSFQLAWLTFFHAKARTAVAVAGISFSTLLVFMQLGLFGSVVDTASVIYDQLHFDLLLVSPEYVFLSKAGSFPHQRLHQAEAIPGVASAAPLYIGRKPWRNPQTRKRLNILVLGFNPKDAIFRLPEVDGYRETLQQPDTAIIDRWTRPEYGSQETGVRTEVDRHQVEIVGQYRWGFGFNAYGAIIVSDQNFFRIQEQAQFDRVNIGLVRLKPGADREQVARSLRAELPEDVRVLTRDEIYDVEKQYWIGQTSVGFTFGFGTVVAAIVGTVILYQVLSTDIASHLREYATLKAVGYSNGFLIKVVLWKVVILVLLSFVPAFLLALVLYDVTRQVTNLPLVMSTGYVVSVLLINLSMGVLSGLLALRKLRTADPADLY
jgi:putative ABC transport system permease protein